MEHYFTRILSILFDIKTVVYILAKNALSTGSIPQANRARLFEIINKWELEAEQNDSEVKNENNNT